MAAYVRRWGRFSPAPDTNRSARDRPGPGTGTPQTAERLPAASWSGRDPQGALGRFSGCFSVPLSRCPASSAFPDRHRFFCGRSAQAAADGSFSPPQAAQRRGQYRAAPCGRSVSARPRSRGPIPGALEDRSPPAVLSFMGQTSPSADPGGPVEPSGWARGRCADPEAAHACGFRPDGRPPAPAAQRSGGAKTGEA